MSAKAVLAIDPGSAKCGMALAQRDERGKVRLIWRCIEPRETAVSKIEEARGAAPFEMLVVGSGTTSKGLIAEIRERFPSLAVLTVDEKDTTLQARERYWEHHPRRGWRKLLPATLQVPPEPVDDFAALILAERVLAQ